MCSSNADALAEMVGMRAHGFDFAGGGLEPFQRDDPANPVALPRGPDRDAGCLQTGQVECEDMTGRRIGVHAGKMQAQQLPRCST
jgi:hypothetical protein